MKSMQAFVITPEETLELMAAEKSDNENDWYLIQIEFNTSIGQLIERFAQSKLTNETILFLKAAKKLSTTGDDDLLKLAEDLYETYIKPGSKDQVNIAHSQVQSLRRAMDNLKNLQEDPAAKPEAIKLAHDSVRKEITACRQEAITLLKDNITIPFDKEVRKSIAAMEETIQVSNKELFNLHRETLKYKNAHATKRTGLLSAFDKDDRRVPKSQIATAIANELAKMISKGKVLTYDEFISQVTQNLTDVALRLFNATINDSPKKEASKGIAEILTKVKTHLTTTPAQASRKQIEK